MGERSPSSSSPGRSRSDAGAAIAPARPSRRPRSPRSSSRSTTTSRGPLDVQEGESKERDGAVVRDLSYAGPEGRITAYYVTPQGDGPFPAVVFMHGSPGQRVTFLGEAIELAQRGIASVLPDAPFARVPAPARRRFHRRRSRPTQPARRRAPPRRRLPRRAGRRRPEPPRLRRLQLGRLPRRELRRRRAPRRLVRPHLGRAAAQRAPRGDRRGA